MRLSTGPTPVRDRNGNMHCMVKVPNNNPNARTRMKGRFVCNSMCGLPTKKPSRKCGYGGGQSFLAPRRMMGGYPQIGGY